MMRSVCFAAMLSGISFSVAAGCDGSVCSGEISSFAESLKVTSDGLMISVIRGVDRKVLSCELVNDKFIDIPTQSKNTDAIYSLLLTAFAANAQVNIEFNSANKYCEVGSVELLPSN